MKRQLDMMFKTGVNAFTLDVRRSYYDYSLATMPPGYAQSDDTRQGTTVSHSVTPPQAPSHPTIVFTASFTVCCQSFTSNASTIYISGATSDNIESYLNSTDVTPTRGYTVDHVCTFSHSTSHLCSHCPYSLLL
jgi:hypothetical protein